MIQIISKVTFEGIHFWANAPERVSFLQNPHRHEFTVVAKKKVNHNDRDIEFIILKHEILKSLTEKYSVIDNILQLGQSSCEMVAEFLLDRHGLSSCQVWEDGENGGEVSQ